VQGETGMKWSTVTRALGDLRDAGFITSHQPRKDYQGEAGETRYRSFPTIHTITKTCFARLGIDLAWLEDERHKANERDQVGPEPLVNVVAMRERRRLVRAQQLAAKRTRVQPPRSRPPPRRRE
jgi:DNA-binding transcriptional ArsR family regulator